MIEASTFSYQYGFDNCKTKVAQHFLDFNLSSIVIEDAKEGEIWDKDAEGASVDELSPPTLEEVSTGEAIHPSTKKLPLATPMHEEEA